MRYPVKASKAVGAVAGGYIGSFVFPYWGAEAAGFFAKPVAEASVKALPIIGTGLSWLTNNVPLMQSLYEQAWVLPATARAKYEAYNNLTSYLAPTSGVLAYFGSRALGYGTYYSVK